MIIHCRQKLNMHHTMSDSPVGGNNTTSRIQRATSADFGNNPSIDDRQLRSTINHNPTPVLNRRLQRISGWLISFASLIDAIITASLPECINVSDCRRVFVVAGSFSVDLVSLAARDTRDIRGGLRSFAGSQRDGGS